MRILAAAAATALCICVSPTLAQTQRPPTSVPNRPAGGPFGTSWAQPYPQTGGYIYNDPRLPQYPRSGNYRAAVCPNGYFDPAYGSCR